MCDASVSNADKLFEIFIINDQGFKVPPGDMIWTRSGRRRALSNSILEFLL